MTATKILLDKNMLPRNWKRIAILQILLCLTTIEAHVEESQYDDSIYRDSNFVLNGGQFIKHGFNYIPEKEDWQQKFAATISKAVDGDNRGSEYIDSNSDEIHNYHKDTTSDMGTNYQRATTSGHLYVSPPLDPQVSVTREGLSCGNESFPQQVGNPEVQTGVVNIASNRPDQQYSNNEKGEILIHRPAPIIVNRPPTRVVVNHPPLIVKPAPVIFHRPPAVIVRQVFVRPRPEPPKMHPVYVKVVKPPPEKIFIKDHISCGDYYNMKPDCPLKRQHGHRQCPLQYAMP